MNVLYDRERIGRFNEKRFSPEDRIRLRQLRMELVQLWFPPQVREIKLWQRNAGINNSAAIRKFASKSRDDKELFFQEAESFIYRVRYQSQLNYQEQVMTIPKTVIDPYCILGVEKSMFFKHIRIQYRKLVLENHPDHGGNPEHFIQIQQAYETVARHNTSPTN